MALTLFYMLEPIISDGITFEGVGTLYALFSIASPYSPCHIFYQNAVFICVLFCNVLFEL